MTKSYTYICKIVKPRGFLARRWVCLAVVPDVWGNPRQFQDQVVRARSGDQMICILWPYEWSGRQFWLMIHGNSTWEYKATTVGFLLAVNPPYTEAVGLDKSAALSFSWRLFSLGDTVRATSKKEYWFYPTAQCIICTLCTVGQYCRDSVRLFRWISINFGVEDKHQKWVHRQIEFWFLSMKHDAEFRLKQKIFICAYNRI
jgi:hypothetical protein